MIHRRNTDIYKYTHTHIYIYVCVCVHIMILTILHTHSLYVPFMSLKLLPSVVSASQMMGLPRVVWDQLTNPAADNTWCLWWLGSFPFENPWQPETDNTWHGLPGLPITHGDWVINPQKTSDNSYTTHGMPLSHMKVARVHQLRCFSDDLIEAGSRDMCGLLLWASTVSAYLVYLFCIKYTCISSPHQVTSEMKCMLVSDGFMVCSRAPTENRRHRTQRHGLVFTWHINDSQLWRRHDAVKYPSKTSRRFQTYLTCFRHVLDISKNI